MIRYTTIKLQDETIYSEAKGYTVTRHGDTIEIRNKAFPRVMHVPWATVREAEVGLDKPRTEE